MYKSDRYPGCCGAEAGSSRPFRRRFALPASADPRKAPNRLSSVDGCALSGLRGLRPPVVAAAFRLAGSQTHISPMSEDSLMETSFGEPIRLSNRSSANRQKMLTASIAVPARIALLRFVFSTRISLLGCQEFRVPPRL